MKKEIKIIMEEAGVKVSCEKLYLNVTVKEKTINSKTFFDILEYDIKNEYVVHKEEITDERIMSFNNQEKEVYRLLNYCYDLLNSTIYQLNIKSKEINEKLSSE